MGRGGETGGERVNERGDEGGKASEKCATHINGDLGVVSHYF